MNNQLFEFFLALQFAIRMNRTFHVPRETKKVHRTGMFENNVWNLSVLNRVHPIDWSGSADDIETRPECETISKKLKANTEAYSECPMIRLGKNTGILHCDGHWFCYPGAERLYQLLRPAPVLEKFILKYSLAVHSRSFIGSGDYKQCTGYKVPHFLRKRKGATNADKEIGYKSCFLWKKGNLEYVIKESEAPKLRNGENIFIAQDKQYDWTNLSNVKVHTLGDLPGTEHLSEIQVIAAEIFTLVRSNFFVGNIASTFSWTVCLARGMKRLKQSSMCELVMTNRGLPIYS